MEEQAVETNRICLSAAGVYECIMLANKYDIPVGKVIDLITDFINI
jgi:hypothetical protein